MIGSSDVALVRQLVLDAGRRLAVAPADDDPLLLEQAQPLGQRPRADTGAGVLELGEPARSLGEIVDEQSRPLCADDLGATGDRTGLVMHVLHRAHRHTPSVLGTVAPVPSQRHDRPPLAHPPGRRRRPCHDRGEPRDRAQRRPTDGIRVIAATPHVRDDYPTSAGTMERLVARAAGGDPGARGFRSTFVPAARSRSTGSTASRTTI